jgi:hypothetical protein
VISSGLSPSNCAEKTKRKPACLTCRFRVPLKQLSDCGALPSLIFPTVRNEEVVGSNPISSTKCLRSSPETWVTQRT